MVLLLIIQNVDKMLLYKPQKKLNTANQLYGSALGLYLSEFTKDGNKLIITPDNFVAAQLERELKFFAKDKKIHFLPDWETLPYDLFSPHQDIISSRLIILNELQKSKAAIFICAIATLLHNFCPPEFLNKYSLLLKLGQKLNINTFRSNLCEAGYYNVSKVLEHGEYAVRGSIIDVFPMGVKRPIRIELFDEEIENLRYFDPETQRTIDKVTSINILPAKEFPLDDASITKFRENYRLKFPGKTTYIYDSVSKGNPPAGIEYYFPLFYDATATIFDYLPQDISICLVENTYDKAEEFYKEAKQRFEQLRYDINRPLLDVAELFIKPEEFFKALKSYTTIKLGHNSSLKLQTNLAVSKPPKLPIDCKLDKPLLALQNYLTQKKASKVLIVAESLGRREVLLELLKQHEIIPQLVASWDDFLAQKLKLAITTAPLTYGLELDEHKTIIIVESQIFGEQPISQKQSRTKTINPDLIIKDMAELSVGAAVVHLNYGVGRYLGLTTLIANNISSEFIILAYAADDKIYVPVTSLHLISRYSGMNAPLNKLGSGTWEREKKKACLKIHDVAAQLLEVYAKRAAQPGLSYEVHKDDYTRFISGFSYTETVDQTKAINDVISDLQLESAMDRLICGDVGFGKTEVAMRGAFIVANNGFQVCIIAPTTLLAGQHYNTFNDRFADFPINIALLSRFQSAKETKKILERIDNGQIDIVIGTHKLLQKTVKFKSLRLLIIDEEHRFGVKQKEQLKALRANVDILSMTATPIPRTLNMAMAKMRDISLITTPPAKRLAIKTFWQERNSSIMREAILRETMRGGQVFLVHNNTETILKVCDEVQSAVPECSVNFAHGQMKERELERIMTDFYHHRFNVLVCTTIIETGIDIPTANTIIIDRADKFGLAQLHQLRGRVGRSHHQAYAYLFTPEEKLLTKDSIKRLEAITALEELGAGFTLATHDLEIRGAGELLGEEQSGNIHSIGFSLYMELLERAVADSKDGREIQLEPKLNTEIDWRISAIIPEEYVFDVHARLILYKKISNAQDAQQVDAVLIEMIDRFGMLPETVKNLCELQNLKIFCQALDINKLMANKQKATIKFNEQNCIDPARLIKLVQLFPNKYKLQGSTSITFYFDDENFKNQIKDLKAFLGQVCSETTLVA